MKKIFITFVYALLFHFAGYSQSCPPCPSFISIRDTINCNFVELHGQAPGGNYANTDSTALRVCQNTIMKYMVMPFGFGTTGQCNYPTFQIDTVLVAGGTLVSFTNSSFTINWGSGNTGTVQIQFTIPGGGSAGGAQGCTGTLIIHYQLIPNPIAAFVASPNPACFNNPTNISFNSSGSVGAVSYFWNFGDGFTSTDANPVHPYTAPGTYTVCLTVTNSGGVSNGTAVSGNCPSCAATICHDVIITNLPGPDISCIATVCAGETGTYCTSASCATYNWVVTGGTIVSPPNSPCITVLWGSGNPQGNIHLDVPGCPGFCSLGTDITVPIIPATTTVNGATIVCIGSTNSYSVPTLPGTTYNWTISGGQLINGNNTNTAQINTTWNIAGTYTVTCNYYDSALNCGGLATTIVNVLPEMKITGPVKRCAGTGSTLHSAIVSPAINVPSNWTISPAGAIITGGNGTSFVNISWPTPGTYVVTATPVSSGIVCSPVSYTVVVYPQPILSAIVGADSICANGVMNYSAVSNMAGIFTWNVVGGSFVNLGSNNDSIQITWNPSGPYSISVSQSSYANNCVSNTISKTVYPYPNPIVNGATTVCADAIESYTITNIGTQNFNWHVYPAQFGTVISATGNTVQIKWHGDNNPGGSNVVQLHFGFCKDDSIAITINEPIAPTVTIAGTLCVGAGITLSASGTGSFSWSHLEAPPVTSTSSSLSNVNYPGHYTVIITNYNGTGCTVTKTVNIPNVGRPVAQIFAGGPLVYCDPNLPNMNLTAVSGVGYSYQWYKNNVVIPGATNSIYAVNSGNIPAGIGSYNFHCIVFLGGCTDTSNHIIVNVINCPTGQPDTTAPCGASFKITNITGCNPFTLSLGNILPSGSSIVPGSATIFHYDDLTQVSGTTTKTYTTIGVKQITICVDILKPDLSVCHVCKDTFVTVDIASKFLANNNCGVISLTDLSTVVSSATIASYAWTVAPSGSFNNTTIASPTLTVLTTGAYTITQTVTSSNGCVTSSTQTLNIVLPNAAFNVSNSCVGTAVNLNNLFPAPINYWNFGDLTSSNTSPTFHAYASTGTFNIVHTVTDAQGCTNTVSNPITIVAAPICTIAYAGSTTFCSGDSIKLNACTGYVGYQWFNNATAIAGATSQIYYATQTGNYSFTAVNPSGCDVHSDTVAITVLQSPSTSILLGGSRCEGDVFSIAVPSCSSCFYQWEVDGTVVLAGPVNSYSGTVGVAPLLVGPHLIKVTIFGSNGCISKDSVNVIFNPQPTVSIAVTGNPPQLCSNNIYTFTASTNANSPVWAWTFGNLNPILSTTNVLTATSAGLYHVLVTDGITGCTNSAMQGIDESPNLTLFPIGCDTLCSNATVFLPLASFNGNISGYTISWYDNAPPYTPVIGTGASLNLNSLPLGPHNLSVIVVGPNGCIDTSNVYYIYIVPGSSSNTTATACGSYTWTVNGVTYTSSGTYTHTGVNANGCPQNDTLNLTISTSTIVTTNITACDTYTWPLNGVTYTASGSYLFQITLPNGCVEIHKLILVINHSNDSVTNATACGSYTWAANGATYTASGTYSFTTLNAFGCTQYNILNLIISNGSSSLTNATACSSYTWSVNGVTYTSSGTYIHTVLLSSGCIQTDSLVLTIGAGSSTSTSITACDSYTWPLNGITYTSSGIYTHVLIDPATGCDHIDSLILTIHHSTDSITTAVACGSYTWAANGVTYTASGNYTFTSLNANGCPQFNLLHLTIVSGTSTTTSATACGPYTWAVNGVTYTMSGNYTHTIQNANGCVDTLKLNLVIQPNPPIVQTIVSCDMYTWPVNGVTYTASGVYTYTTLNANGCIQTYTLNLTINTTTITTSYVIACGSYTWPVNGQTYTTSCVFTVIDYSGTGCPHLYVLCLTILPNTSSSTSVTACNSYVWPVTGQTYTNSGIYTFTSLNANGCQHKDSLILTILPSTSSSVSASACNSYTWPLNGVTYTASGVYTFTTLNAQGCPHTTILNLTILTGVNNTINVIACDSYTWFGTTYTASGNYTHTSLNANGCVQTTTLHLTINTTTVITVYATACNSYTWTVNGVTYTASGSYTVMTIGPNGCPKLNVLCLTILPNTTTTTTITRCNSYTWPANSVTYTASGTYTYTSLNASGCISTSILILTINHSTSSTVNITACNSYTWPVNGVTYSNSGVYTFTALNTQGCVHTYTLNLTINHGVGSSTNITVCNEYTWPVNGVTYTASGTYTYTSLNSNGCVNSYTLILVVNHGSNTSTTVTACDSYTWLVNGITYTSSGTYTYTTMSADGCLNTNTLHLTINISNHSTVNVIGCDAYTWSANGVTYTASGTYTFTSQNANGCIDHDTLILIMGTTTITHIFDTACCEYTWDENGVTYNTSGIYPYVTTSADGCPHIIILCVMIYPCTGTSTSVFACGSYTWPLNGVTYTTSGTYTHTSLNTYGCPTTDTLVLTVGATVTTTSACDTVCDSFTWVMNGTTYTHSGVYTYITNDTNGCPHIYILCITINHHTDTVIDVTAANSYTWAATGITYNVSGNYTTTLIGSNGCDSMITMHLVITGTPIGASISPRVFLSGPYVPSTGLMQDSIRQYGLIPLTEPYSGAPFYKPQLLGGGGETTTSAVLSVTGPNAIVDWVHIEIRSATNSSLLIATKNALLQRDGDVVSTDGVSPLYFPTLPVGNYYVSVKHRNHLGVMTAIPLPLNFGNILVDFINGPIFNMPSVTTNTPTNYTGSVNLLWSGDPNINKNVKYNGAYNDKDPILLTVGAGTPNNTVYGYRLEDLNMDGKVRYNNPDNDRAIILNNVGVSTPNKVLSQHTPN